MSFIETTDLDELRNLPPIIYKAEFYWPILEFIAPLVQKRAE